MSVKKSKNRGLVHIPSGEIYTFTEEDRLILCCKSKEQVMSELDKFYSFNILSSIKQLDKYHTFLWYCADVTDRDVLFMSEHEMSFNPPFELSEFEVIC